jgi:type II secretory pathway pseudopilin PulG
MKFKIQNVKLKMAFTLIELLVAIAVIGIPAEDEARQD